MSSVVAIQDPPTHSTFGSCRKSGAVAREIPPVGQTPANLLRSLSAESLDWSRVWVTLADERWVEAIEENSNERMVRESLLVGPAAKANFVGLKNPSAAVDQAVDWPGHSTHRLRPPAYRGGRQVAGLPQGERAWTRHGISCPRHPASATGAGRRLLGSLEPNASSRDSPGC